MSEKPGKRLVSRREYALRKTLAISLSVLLSVCGIGSVLSLVKAFFFYALEVRSDAAAGPSANAYVATESEHDLSGIGYVLAGYFFFIFFLWFIAALALWWASRKSWKTVHALQPVDFTDT